MEKTQVKKTLVFISICLCFLVGVVIVHIIQFYDGKLHIVFCDVGQGDGILITTPERTRILVDGGSDSSMLSCLSKHMPFWERRIHVMVLSHPHADHYQGLILVMRRYTIDTFVTEDLLNTTGGFEAFSNEIKKQQVKTKTLFAGDRIDFDSGIQFFVLGPTHAYLRQTSPQKYIGETGEFASLITLLQYKNFKVLFTGDSQASGIKASKKNGKIDVLQVPHHGSKTGLTREMIKDIAPKAAIVSVGKNNYGHPSQEIISLLETEKSHVYRTDKHGDIEIIVGEEKWWVDF